MEHKTKIFLASGLIFLCVGLLAFLSRGEPAQGPEMTVMAFLSGMEEENGRMSVFAEEAVWLTGREGEDAAIEAGLCTEDSRGECLPNDFFIKKLPQSRGRIQIHPEANIFLLTLGESVQRMGVSQQFLQEILNAKDSYWPTIPFELKVRGDEVIEIVEVYVP